MPNHAALSREMPNRRRHGNGDGHLQNAALMREAEEYGADAVVDVRFEVDGVKSSDIEGVPLQRVIATGLAVRFARAA